MTDYTELARVLRDGGIRVRENEPLALYTTFRIGGAARILCEPDSEDEIRRILVAANAAHARVYVLGRGSNTLFADEGFDGLVLFMRNSEIRFDPENPLCFTATAGDSLTAVSKKAQQKGLTGLEFAYGIPGSVGGAVFMNAGAYEGEMKDVVTAVEYLDMQCGERHVLTGEQLAFGYRSSWFERHGGVILRVQFTLRAADPAAIGAKMEQLLQRRVEKQPLDKPSAGSTFKRPQGEYAARLIERCGLKGFQVGGAAVSEKHAGFVVNLGGATCADVLAVADHVAAVVKEKTGYTLEREIRVVR